jgi:REP element-mobilizing transposase RayT
MALPVPTKPQSRRRMRLPDYDYARPGGYFVTICTRNRSCLLGKIIDGRMHPYESGRIVEDCWINLPDHYSNIALDEFVVMPNHIHGLFFIEDQPVPGQALPEIIRAFKSCSARRANEARHTQGRSLWQRGYFERIIRGTTSLEKTREYISNNPLRWHLDRNNPANFESLGDAGRSQTGPYITLENRRGGSETRPSDP